MTDYKVTDTELTSVANAIRQKGDTISPIVFPSGFITSINDLPNTVIVSSDRYSVEDETLVIEDIES